MVIPVCREEQWLATIARAEPWTPPSVDTIVIAPHPDDESLATGGLIATLVSRGCEVGIIAVTDGENAYNDGQTIGELRRSEQERALEQLGLPLENIHRLGFPDSDVTAHEGELMETLPPLISRSNHVIAPWPGDFHPDHEACGRAAQRVARLTENQLTFYLFWTWHRGSPSLLSDLRLLSFEIAPDQQRAKLDAVHCHHSQLVHPSGLPILPDELLWPAKQPFEIYLPA